MLERLGWLLMLHALCDYALQPDWMAQHKSPLDPPPARFGTWWWVLTAHALIQGLGVAMVCSLTLGYAEAVVHGLTDYAKCRGWIGPKLDQSIHLGSKVLWAVLA